jgi:hypothetical protein
MFQETDRLLTDYHQPEALLMRSPQIAIAKQISSSKPKNWFFERQS